MKKQNVLYLICASTALDSRVIGMSIMENGVISDGPSDSRQWPYKTVIDAIHEGWRIVQFPVALPIPDNSQSYYPCEFILEKIVEV